MSAVKPSGLTQGIIDQIKAGQDVLPEAIRTAQGSLLEDARKDLTVLIGLKDDQISSIENERVRKIVVSAQKKGDVITFLAGQVAARVKAGDDLAVLEKLLTTLANLLQATRLKLSAALGDVAPAPAAAPAEENAGAAPAPAGDGGGVVQPVADELTAATGTTDLWLSSGVFDPSKLGDYITHILSSHPEIKDMEAFEPRLGRNGDRLGQMAAAKKCTLEALRAEIREIAERFWAMASALQATLSDVLPVVSVVSMPETKKAALKGGIERFLSEYPLLKGEELAGLLATCAEQIKFLANAMGTDVTESGIRRLIKEAALEATPAAAPAASDEEVSPEARRRAGLSPLPARPPGPETGEEAPPAAAELGLFADALHRNANGDGAHRAAVAAPAEAEPSLVALAAAAPADATLFSLSPAGDGSADTPAAAAVAPAVPERAPVPAIDPEAERAFATAEADEVAELEKLFTKIAAGKAKITEDDVDALQAWIDAARSPDPESGRAPREPHVKILLFFARAKALMKQHEIVIEAKGEPDSVFKAFMEALLHPEVEQEITAAILDELRKVKKGQQGKEKRAYHDIDILLALLEAAQEGDLGKPTERYWVAKNACWNLRFNKNPELYEDYMALYVFGRFHQMYGDNKNGLRGDVQGATQCYQEALQLLEENPNPEWEAAIRQALNSMN